MIANEAVEEAKRNHKPCMVFKVDIERAYDSVSWAFIHDEENGFLFKVDKMD